MLVPTYIIAAWLCIDVTSAYKCKIALTDQKVYYLYVGIGLEYVIPIALKCWLLHIKIVFHVKRHSRHPMDSLSSFFTSMIINEISDKNKIHSLTSMYILSTFCQKKMNT